MSCLFCLFYLFGCLFVDVFVVYYPQLLSKYLGCLNYTVSSYNVVRGALGILSFIAIRSHKVLCDANYYIKRMENAVYWKYQNGMMLVALYKLSCRLAVF